MVRMELYNVRGLSWREEGKFGGEGTVAVGALFVTVFNQYIQEHTSSDYAEDKFI